MNTTERLTQYYDFSPAVLEAVTEAAEEQNSHSFQQLATRYGLENGPEVYFDGIHGRTAHPIEYALLKPETDYDESHMRVLHLPMACPIDPNMVMRGIRLFRADSSMPLMLVGNPSSIGATQTKLSLQEAGDIFLQKDLAPAVNPLLYFLERRLGVTSVEHLGYSYGATKAVAAVIESHRFDQEVPNGVFIEPANIVRRSLWKLFGDFIGSNAELEEYVQQTECPPLLEARSGGGKKETALWLLGLARLSNLAIASVLGRDGFEKSIHTAMDAQPDMHATIGWGTASRITPDETMRQLAEWLRAAHPERLKAMEFDGMPHAGGDDIDLHAAMMLQGLQATK